MFAHGYLPLISKPRITEYSATLIDHMYTNKTLTNMKTGVLITDVSDHFGTIIYNKHRINQNDKIIRTRSINEENINTFKSMDITLKLSQTDANKAYELFLEQYQQRFDTHFPLKEIND